MLVCGAVVPLTFWPGWVQWIAQTLPVTHGLEAVRALQTGASIGAVGADLGLALATGAAWMVLAAALFTLFGESGRRDGSIDLDE